MVNKYKSADEPERHRLRKKLRRAHLRSSSDDLDGQGDGPSSPIAGHLLSVPENSVAIDSRARQPGDNKSNSHSDSVLVDGINGDKARKNNLEEKRALWEGTLPKKLSRVPESSMDSNHTYIEANNTPTKPYGLRRQEEILATKRKEANSFRKQAASRLPFF